MRPYYITLPFLIALGGAILLAVLARQGLEYSYTRDSRQALGQASASVLAIGATVEAYADGRIDEPRARQDLDESAAAGEAVLAPLVASPPMRGSFLEAPSTSAYHTASLLTMELDGLQTAVQEQASLNQVIYRAEHALRWASASDVLAASVPPRALEVPRSIWIRTYASEFQRADAAAQPPIDEVVRFKNEDLRARTDPERWGEFGRRLQQVKADVRMYGDRVRVLGTPPEALEASQRHAAAQGHLEAALEKLEAYASSEGREQNALTDAENELGTYRGERGRSLEALQRAVGG